jgi:tRNA1Val (adenine37-N6)-methyltransferase
MANTWFQFKQFRIEQDRCAMKVTQDAVLFGSWVIEQCRGDNLQHILDIGTGTGLLSLMLAQELPAAMLTAIELDAEASVQAAENVRESPWKDRVCVVHEDVFPFAERHPSSFDVIICNPPFFSDHQKNPDGREALARHSTRDWHSRLVQTMERMLTPAGSAFLLIPATEHLHFQGFFEKSTLLETSICSVRKNATAAVSRLFLRLQRKDNSSYRSEIAVHTSNGSLSGEAVTLLRPFNLYL